MNEPEETDPQILTDYDNYYATMRDMVADYSHDMIIVLLRAIMQPVTTEMAFGMLDALADRLRELGT